MTVAPGSQATGRPAPEPSAGVPPGRPLRIVQILPGSGDSFFCENCARDNSLVRSLQDAGHEVAAAPLYLPHRLDPAERVRQAPVFFGGINVYLQQNFGLFRRTPRWLDRLFDSRWLLRLVARRAGSVRARGLGEMTLSMLQGADGKQAKELSRLAAWLGAIPRPDVVHLSSPLLLGIGVEIKKRMGVPLVATLQDEDEWVEAMEPPYAEKVWAAMAERAREVDAFVSVSKFFGEVMRSKLSIDPSKLIVVPPGVNGADFSPAPAAPDPPSIGYLARMSEAMGLGVLVEAFLRLKAGRFPALRLHVSGGSTGDDREFLDGLQAILAERGVLGDVCFFEEFDLAARQKFFQSLTLFSVPAPKGIAFGIYLLESLASGVPVALPRVGAFPEIVGATGGGILYDPAGPEALARALGELLDDQDRRARLARQGRQGVLAEFGLEKMTEAMVGVYRSLL